MTLQQLNEHLNMVLQLEEAQSILNSLRGQILGAQRIDGMPHAQEASRKTEILAVILQQQEEEVERIKKITRSSEEEVKGFIDSIEDNRTKMIFNLRFLCGLKWEAVAAMIGCGNTIDGVKLTCYRYLDIKDATH